MTTTYCIDSSSLIRLFSEVAFKPLRAKLLELIDSDRIVSPMEVCNELMRGTDDLAAWAKSNREMFRHPVEGEVEILAEILKKFPDTSKIDNEFDADPWLVASALAFNREQQGEMFASRMVIVAEDSKALRHLCDNLGVVRISLIDMLVAEGLIKIA